MAVALSRLETGKPPTHKHVLCGAILIAQQVTPADPQKNNEVIRYEKN